MDGYADWAVVEKTRGAIHRIRLSAEELLPRGIFGATQSDRYSGDAGPERYAKAVQMCRILEMMVCWYLTPQAMTDPSGTAEQLKLFATTSRANAAGVVGWADRIVEPGQQFPTMPECPTLQIPGRGGARVYYMWRYSL